MKNKEKKYPLLKPDDFKKIAKETGYSSAHVRQILRGYVEKTKKHDLIIEKADEIQKQKLSKLKW